MQLFISIFLPAFTLKGTRVYIVQSRLNRVKLLDAHAIPNAAGIYDIVPTIDALFCSALVETIFLLSMASGE